jgi:CDP-glycerol glycerophosphotransferase
MDNEKKYIWKRIFKAWYQSCFFYVFRIFPIKKKKIVFCCIEGTTGYSCNPKYIAEEFLRRDDGYELVWLVNDTKKKFPKGITVVRNSLWNRAYQLTTAGIWIDNSRKQLEVRKRSNQLYIQTWHAKIGFKPTCLDRGKSFSKIAYLVSKHDSNMIDYVLSNSDWYDETLPNGMLYTGSVLRTGSPRCDILVNNKIEAHKRVRKLYHLPQSAKIVMYAPTFRGGNQETNRAIQKNNHIPDFELLLRALKKKFCGEWFVFLRLHPQLTVRNISSIENGEKLIDISKADDMYEFLAGCDAFITDYSSAAFDAAVMRVPIFIYADDYRTYESERGKLLWDLNSLPFPLASSNQELQKKISEFSETEYQKNLSLLFTDTKMSEKGIASKDVVDFICKYTNT